jgi:3',5'-cyclic AMP phosphodiesterase CpdA
LRIGHISDLHVSDRRRYPRNGFAARDCDRHSSRLLKGLLAALRTAAVEHLVVTGDLTFSSEASEFERVADMLRPWAEKGKLTVVPGNHDVWTSDAHASGRFLRAIGPDGRGMRKPTAVYPLPVVLSPGVVLIALDSARHGEKPFETPGRLGQAQLQATRELVRAHAKEGRAVLLALHHHLVLPMERVPSDAFVARMPLADADQVVRLVAELPVAAVLHGHRHCAFRVDLPGAAGPTPVLCAGSASRAADEPVRRARAYLYEVDKGGVRNVEAMVASVE